MTNLRTAAQQALEALVSENSLSAVAMQQRMDAITALHAALAEPEPPPEAQTEAEKIAYCAGWWDALAKARKAEPVQEPVWVCPDSAEHRYQKPGHCEDCGKTLVQVAEPVQQGCDHCNHPLYAAIKCRVCGRVTEPVQEQQCNPHPKAPHGFLRNASHTEDRYVCECEYWDPYQAGYQAGMEAAHGIGGSDAVSVP